MSAQHTPGPLAEIREIDRIATLRYVAEAGTGGRPCSYCAANAKTLERHGLLTKVFRARGKASYVITEAGRAAIAKATGGAS